MKASEKTQLSSVILPKSETESAQKHFRMFGFLNGMFFFSSQTSNSSMVEQDNRENSPRQVGSAQRVH